MSVKHQRVKFWLLKTNLKALAKKKRKAKYGEKMSGKKKEMVRKKRVCRKSEETLVILHMLIFLICL